MIAMGVGCRRGAAAEEVVALMREALALLPTPLSDGGEAERGTVTIGGLFTLEDKRDEPGLAEAARVLGFQLTFLDRAVLALVAGEARSCSRRVEEMFGLPGIAETAALAGAGPGRRAAGATDWRPPASPARSRGRRGHDHPLHRRRPWRTRPHHRARGAT